MGGGFEDYLWSLSADESANREAASSSVPEESSDQADLHLDRAGAKPAAAAILDFATQHDIDLIMMAAHTHSVLGKRVFGGVQLEVLRWSPCAVMTGRRERAVALAERYFRHILVPVDFSPRSGYSLRAAVEISDRYDAKLSILHVQEERVIPRFTERGLTRFPVPSDPGYQEHIDEAMEHFVEIQGVSNRDIACHTSSGFVGARVAAFATSNEVDLVVISAKGLTDDPEVEIGRATDRIVRRAPCPVLTVKR
jgi:nucleotide-binding universal stress UspA family protein